MGMTRRSTNMESYVVLYVLGDTLKCDMLPELGEQGLNDFLSGLFEQGVKESTIEINPYPEDGDVTDLINDYLERY